MHGSGSGATSNATNIVAAESSLLHPFPETLWPLLRSHTLVMSAVLQFFSIIDWVCSKETIQNRVGDLLNF